MYSIEIFFFSLHNHAGFRAGLLNRMILVLSLLHYQLYNYRTVSCKALVFFQSSRIFLRFIHSRKDQMATAENAMIRLVNVTALSYNLMIYKQI